MWRGEQSASVPGQLFPSFRPPRVSVDSFRGNALFEPVQLEFEVLYLLPKIFELLRTSVSVVRDGHYNSTNTS